MVEIELAKLVTELLSSGLTSALLLYLLVDERRLRSEAVKGHIETLKKFAGDEEEEASKQ